VGFEEGGKLTEALRRRPYSVVLFDEIEKAHPDVFNLLLQILDDGRITDSHGRTVNFKNTVLILTSNIGAPYLMEGITPEGDITENARNGVMQALRGAFRPEFLNRVDDVVLFKPLRMAEVARIAGLLLEDLGHRLEDMGMSFKATPEALEYIARESYDPAYGARPLKRYISRNVETRLARELVGGEIPQGAAITLETSGSSLEIRWKEPPPPESSNGDVVEGEIVE
jgi:ATP-dependent Clp protease ATP-binding subunit ClpB